MSLLARHIAGSVLLGIGLVLMVFLGLILVFVLIEELAEADALTALTFVLFTMPRRVVELLPYAAFIGTLLGLGHLASNGELVVMRASGYSTWRVFGAVCLPALLVLLVSALLSEWVAPAGEERAAAVQYRAEAAAETLYIDGGHWYREGPLYVSVDGIGADDSLSGVAIYELGEDKRLRTVRWAARAEYQRARGGGQLQHLWLLKDVVETDFTIRRNGRRGAETRRLSEYVWRSAADPRLLSARALLEPRRMALSDLAYQVDYMNREGLSPVRYQLALWDKLLQPLAVLGLCLLACAFVLGPLRERGIGVRLGVGIIAGLSFKYLQDLFGPVSMVYGLPAWLGVALPIALCWLLGVIGVRRTG